MIGMVMINFRAMKTEEFPAYRDYFVIDYANEIAVNFGYTIEKGLAIAQKELEDDLPQDVSTADNILLCIEESDTNTLGYLWCKCIDNGETAFILDFVIFEDYRGLGYGKTALIVLVERLSQAGVVQIKLRAASDNDRALRLYEKLGFHVTGYNTVKILEL